MTYQKNRHEEKNARAFSEIDKEAAITEKEISAGLLILKSYMKNNQYKEAIEGYRALANLGCTEAEKEYAAFFEKGHLVSKNLDLAMKYYYRAALKNDAYSAYKYSLLAARTNRDIGNFWLVYSAVLGCTSAYPDTAEYFSKLGYEADALYFTYLAASCDDTDSIVAMAKKYYGGDGTEKSAEYAKWYMDKLRFPPIYAIKLAYKLRSTVAKEPPRITLKEYDGLLCKLAAKAKECSFKMAYYKLTHMLSERGNTNAEVELARLMLDGCGCKQNVTEALKLLTKASAMGSVKANLVLGDLHFDERLFPRNTSTAITYYKRAGELGAYQAYELIGDIYYTGAGILVDVPLAVYFYDLAAAAGSASAKTRTDEIKSERKSLFEQALVTQDSEDAFRLFSLSASLGYTDAKLKLAECFELGKGTKINRRSSFLLCREAADSKDVGALFSLGRCYALGVGTKRDYSKAKTLLKKAERLGEERASLLIKEMMERKKRKLSRSHLSIATRLIYMGKYEIAKKHLDAAAYLENAQATYALGCLYEFGVGAICDKVMAYNLYERAFSMLFRDPRSVYKLSILRLVKSKK